MTTKAQLRKAALACPEAEEGTHFGLPAFSVRGKGFASLTTDGWVQLRLPAERVASVLTEHPVAETLSRAGEPIGLRIPLAEVNGMVLNALVHAAWRHRAPERLVAATESTADGDLPTAIGRPATQALHLAGMTTLDQIARRTASDLLALHGVGPKAIRILNEELVRRGDPPLA